MKIGDLVLPRDSFLGSYAAHGIGVLLDVHETDDGIVYFEVQWRHERGWWAQEEMILFHEA